MLSWCNQAIFFYFLYFFFFLGSHSSNVIIKSSIFYTKIVENPLLIGEQVSSTLQLKSFEGKN